MDSPPDPTRDFREPDGTRPPHTDPTSRQPSRLPGWLLFIPLALGHLGVAILLNQVVLGEGAGPAPLPNAPPTPEEVNPLAAARRWEFVGYLLSPVLLLLRIAVSAALVQLALLCVWKPIAYRNAFRAGVIAQYALLLGALLQVAWLLVIAEGQIDAATLQALPGSIASLLPFLTPGPAITLLLQQVTVFDLGWIVLFSLALEDGEEITMTFATVAVLVVWSGVMLAKWGALLYLTGVG